MPRAEAVFASDVERLNPRMPTMTAPELPGGSPGIARVAVSCFNRTAAKFAAKCRRGDGSASAPSRIGSVPTET